MMRLRVYVANTACDKHNLMLRFRLGAGNIHDSQMFHEIFKKLEMFKAAIKAKVSYRKPFFKSHIFSAL